MYPDVCCDVENLLHALKLFCGRWRLFSFPGKEAEAAIIP